MEQIKQSFKFAIKYTEDLERKNALLIQTIKDILNEDDIKELITLVKAFEMSQLEDKKVNRLEEQYPYFVAISFICLLLEWIL